MPSQEIDFTAAKEMLDEAAWLTAHGSYVQAGRKLGDLMRAVERHIAFVEQSIGSEEAAGTSVGRRKLERMRAEHCRLLVLVDAAETFSSRSNRQQCARSLQVLARALEAHRRESSALRRRSR